jgi:hypothetical protein
MNVRRIVVLGIAAGALAAWWASASTATRAPIANPMRRATPVETRGDELAAEIARLRSRLRPTTPPQASSRNLFEFSRSAPRAGAAAPTAIDVTETPPPVAPPLSLRLVGIAEDTGPDGTLRTAILSSSAGQLIFAKPGERVIDRYEVARISGEAAELTDLQDHSTLTLVLK